jgi:UMF1 family MFS transporter
MGCVLLGCAGTMALALTPPGNWNGLLVSFAVSFVMFAIGNVLYDSLLPAVAEAEEMHDVSARGFAWGYIGGGVLLAVHLAMITLPHRFGLPDAATATRVAFASVAVWWFGFSLPLFRRVPEPEAERSGVPARALPAAVFGQLGRTLSGLGAQPDLLRFLIAFWLYSDGIGTIIKMATIYGVEVGLKDADLMGALLMVQIVAAPASIAFGRLAKPLGARGAVLLGDRRLHGDQRVRVLPPAPVAVLGAGVARGAVPGRHAGAVALDVRFAGAARTAAASCSASTR